ncbi:MAG: methionine--tRNA ligase subunit beta, partial [Flavobacteriaceae bacterium]|nr:methionine--tRNA ligase subunit beta [Flavobacteriaceae bacterium]
KYYNGIVPEPSQLQPHEEAILEKMKLYPSIIGDKVERYHFREAQQELMNIARLGNKYLADEEPWKTIKTDEARTKTVLYVALQIASVLSVLSEPFLPHTSKKLRSILHLELDKDSTNLDWISISTLNEYMPTGHQIGPAELLFSKIEESQIQKQLDKLDASKKANQAMNATIQEQKDTIIFDDFTKLDMRVGTIAEAEKMAKTKKLLILKVDTGLDVRTIVSGIAESFTPEEVIGKKVTVLVNLAPRALRGVDSEGMILMTETAEGKLVFLNPDEADGGSVGNGMTIN